MGLVAGLAGTAAMTAAQTGGVLKRDPPDDSTLTNAMHWRHGTVCGAVFGLAMWAWARFVELPALQMAPPPWQDPRLEPSLDVGYHLVHGLGAAAGYALLED